MGGYLVSRLSAAINQPYVAINPVTDVRSSLQKYIGTHRDNFDRSFTLTESILESYPAFVPSDQGMVLLDMADEVIDSTVTLDRLALIMNVKTFAGGTHRFSHMAQALPLIKEWIEQSTLKKSSDSSEA